ncbi:MAG TPA: hypothetical protein VFR75_10225 [Solirubrobacterales bacterium]|nr:hypothetical protein [Solirubrobacterales bacterium]
MKYVKILGLLAVAAAALMAFAGTAMATTVTTTTGGAAATPTIHAVNSGGHVTLANPIANISCSSTVEGKVESHGAGVTAKGNISKLEFTGCTNSWHVTAITNGSLEVHYTSGHNGVLTSSGAKVDTTRFGVTCVYETNNTSIGTVAGGNPAVLTIAASIPINTGESSSLCGTGNAKWEGKYATTSALYIAP